MWSDAYLKVGLDLQRPVMQVKNIKDKLYDKIYMIRELEIAL
jgi:hypothetical protein